MANLLVIEGGRSRSSATVVSDAHEVVRIDGLALPYLSGGSLDPLLSVLTDLVKSVASHGGRFDAAVLGLPSIHNRAGADVVAAHVRSLLVARSVVVTSDAAIHYAGALGQQSGVVVCAVFVVNCVV